MGYKHIYTQMEWNVKYIENIWNMKHTHVYTELILNMKHTYTQIPYTKHTHTQTDGV